MKKVLGSMSKFIFGAFCVAVLALLMTLTYGALQKLFPGNFTNQMWGLVMFDIAAMCWAVAFVFQSHSTTQYAVSGLGFAVGFLGTLGMVAAEVTLSGQNLSSVDTSQIGTWMVYGFIIVTAIHALLVYIHHASAPEIAEQINVGVARGEVVSRAIKDATKTIESQQEELSQAIYNDIVSNVKRDLGMAPIDGTVFDRRNRLDVAPVTWARPTQQEAARSEDLPLWEKIKSNFFRSLTGGKNAILPSTPQQAENAKIALLSDATVAWNERGDGSRERVWCKVCRHEGQDWLSPEPCVHVLRAKAEEFIPYEVAQNTLAKLKQETLPVPSQKGQPE